jgi:aryl-alcohol dehydrogenase-like predicted oxidoreductase
MTNTTMMHLLPARQLGPFTVSAIGLGCMNLSHGYGPAVPDEQSASVIARALDLGVTLFDTAMLYGNGHNELVVGRALKPYRQSITLCTKGGMAANTEPGKPPRRIDSRPDVIRANCLESLQRLDTDVIDLYYLHRWDKTTPLEDVIGAMADLVREGKVRTIGLSEVSAETLRKAHKIHPITAVQSEYSLWTRNPEIALSQACRELGVALVAFSPLGRGFLSARFQDSQSLAALHATDMRHKNPRFQGDALTQNQRLLAPMIEIARQAGCTPSQLALAWCLAQGQHVIPIPGTTSAAHLEEDVLAATIPIDVKWIAAAGELIHQDSVAGHRYDAPGQASVDTEVFSASPGRQTI